MKREYLHWDSTHLDRTMEILWFGERGRPFLWFPTSQGRFYQNEDFGLVAAVGDLIEAGAIQVVCVDSVDAESFYAKDKPPPARMARHDEYDRYLVEEVVPRLLARSPGETRIATLGASFGAYHAVNFGLRHPDVVGKVVGLSGKYDIHAFLDGWWGDSAYFHCPTAYLPNMDAGWVRKLSTLDICVVSGETDNILEGSLELIRLLTGKDIPHRGHIWGQPFGHDWPWWKQQIRHYVP